MKALVAGLVTLALLMANSAALLAADGDAAAAAADPSTLPGPEISPHGDPTLCAACHGPTKDCAALGEVPFVGGDAVAACSRCHASAPHAVGGEAHREGDAPPGLARVPAEFPLADGGLSCATCHDEPACDGRPSSADNHRFLRGGPYKTLGSFCAACHAGKDEQRFNPHQAMVERGDSTLICEYCHEHDPSSAPEQVARVQAPAICHGCHKDSSHAGTKTHLVQLDPAVAKRATEAGLPLTDDGSVFCGTCHDPHPAGSTERSASLKQGVGEPLFTSEQGRAVLAYIQEQRGARYGVETLPPTQDLTEPDFLRKPLRGNGLCSVCHGSGGDPTGPTQEAP